MVLLGGAAGQWWVHSPLVVWRAVFMAGNGTDHLSAINHHRQKIDSDRLARLICQGEQNGQACQAHNVILNNGWLSQPYSCCANSVCRPLLG
jgi:hypothetical protein